MPIKNINKETGDIGELIAGGTLFADSPLLTVVSSYDTVAAPGWKQLTTDAAGRTLSRTEYKELFDLVTERGLIGTGKPFGEGDGSTTFVLPDLRGEFIRGSGTNGHSGQGNGGTVGQHQDATQHIALTPWSSELYFETSAEPGNYDSTTDGPTYQYLQNETEHTGPQTVRSTYSSRPTNTSLNYFMKVKQVPVPVDFVSAMDKIYGVLIPSNASPNNKLATKDDIVVRHDYSIAGTVDAIEDTKALVNHLLTMDAGTYAGEFKRTGITFGTYRLTYFIDGVYAKSVSGIITYSISNDSDATYQVSYVEDIEHGTPPYWKIERLSAINTITRDSTAPVMSGTVYNSLVQKAQANINDIISESSGAYSSLVRRGNIVQCIARFNTESSFVWSTNTKIGTIPQGYRPAVFQPCPTMNFQSAGTTFTFVSIDTNGDIVCIPLSGDRLDLYINLTWYTEDV